MKNAKSLRETLLAGAREGHFLQAVFDSSFAAKNERDDLAREIATLHNEGLVDVIAAFEGLHYNAPDGPDFFLTRNVFGQALPHLSAQVAAVMRCVLRLYREAEQDLLAGTIFNGYIEFCAKDATRPREALMLIEADPVALSDMLAATVAAGSRLSNRYYLAELLRLIRHPNIEVRRSAVFSLARIHWSKGESVPNTTITTLNETVAAETDDRILASAVNSAFALFEQDKTLEEGTVTLIGTALAKGDEYTLHAASELFCQSTKEMPPLLLQLLLTHLKQVRPKNISTLKNIDYGISSLLTRDCPEQGLLFLEELLTAHGGRHSIKDLDCTASEIGKSASLVSKVLTRWFLRGDPALCETVEEIVATHYGDDFRIEIDVSELKPADQVHILLIARKAIGYLFIMPRTAASVIISLMNHAPDDETLDALGELLFNPLLLNYPGSMRDFVEEQTGSESVKVKETIENALVAIKEYLEVLHAIPELPALQAGQSQRESYRRHISESTANYSNDAEKKSIFCDLFARSTLLYGSKAINYFYAGVGEPRRMETPLTSHSVSMEFPRMDNIDPYGLDYMLRIFRLERLRE